MQVRGVAGGRQMGGNGQMNGMGRGTGMGMGQMGISILSDLVALTRWTGGQPGFIPGMAQPGFGGFFMPGQQEMMAQMMMMQANMAQMGEMMQKMAEVGVSFL